MTTREEHLEWCKQRALQYLDRGEVEHAVTSMLSDIAKHPETKLANEYLAMLGMMTIRDNDAEAARRYILGFR
jgi:Tfp pilus assembly protein PilF